MILLLVLLMAAPDLSSIKAEPDLEKRSELSLASADHDVDGAREAYQGGDVKKMTAALEDLRASVSLCAESLEKSHKKAHGSKYYKRAELKTRALVRRLAALSEEVSVEDRKPVEEARQRVQEVHDQLLSDIMRKTK